MKIDIIPHPNGVGDVDSLDWDDVYLPTRASVRQRVLFARTSNAGSKAVILFPGGNGTPITHPRNGGFRLNGNFLVRSSALFAEAGFITAIVELPLATPVKRSESNAFRQSSMHLTDINAVVNFLVSEGAREVFLIGTSRGTLSVAYLATVMTHANVAGYLLTASLAEILPFAQNIRHPVLIAHHSDDGCHVTTYLGAQATFRALVNSPRKNFITVSGGDPAIDDDPCQARTAHGFLGAERETVAAIVEWMNGKTPPANVSP